MKRGCAFTMRALGACWLLVGMCHAVVPAQEVTPKDLEEQAKRFTRTAEMIPMRDGVKLYTTAYAPKEQKAALPFVMLRTPYGIESRGPKALKEYLKDLVDEGYILVFQDIRGRHKSVGLPRQRRYPGPRGCVGQCRLLRGPVRSRGWPLTRRLRNGRSQDDPVRRSCRTSGDAVAELQHPNIV